MMNPNSQKISKGDAIQQIDKLIDQFSRLSTLIDELVPDSDRPPWFPYSIRRWQRSGWPPENDVVHPSASAIRESASRMGKYYEDVRSTLRQTVELINRLIADDKALKIETYFDNVCPYSSPTFINHSPSWKEADAYYSTSQSIINASKNQLEAFKWKIMGSWDNPMGGNNYIVNPHISNSPGIVIVVGQNQKVVANLQTAQPQLAQALSTLTQAVLASYDLPEDKKEEHIEAINQIGEEAAKPKPNKITLKGMINGVLTALNRVPDVASAVTAVMPILSQLHLLP